MENMDQIKDELRIIKEALTGNSLTKDGGMVRDIADIKNDLKRAEQQNHSSYETIHQRLSKIELFKDKILIWGAALMGCGLFIGWIIEQLISVFKK